jgi:hypothetical protein
MFKFLATGTAVLGFKTLLLHIKCTKPWHPSSGNVGFVVDEVALGQVSSKYFAFHK